MIREKLERSLRKSYGDIEDAVCPGLNALIKIIVCHSPKDDWMSFLFMGLSLIYLILLILTV